MLESTKLTNLCFIMCLDTEVIITLYYLNLHKELVTVCFVKGWFGVG